MSNDHLFTLRTYDAHQKEKPRDRTLKQWNEMGYRVLKGMHAVSHDNNGEALFSRTQVVPSNAVRYAEAEQIQAELDQDDIWGPEDEIRMDYY